MELYCIKTHSQKVVVKGNIYPLISDKSPCKCTAVDVGIRINYNFTTGRQMLIGKSYKCDSCDVFYPFKGIWWIDKRLFANIDDISIKEAIEEVNKQPVLIEQH